MDDVRVRPVVVRPVPATGNSIDVHPVLQRIYAARGITQVEDLDYALRGLLPVGSLTGVDEAVALIVANAEKRITIIGDFDADGATSTALVIRCLREFGISNVDYLVPNRFKFGYGLTPEIVRVAAERSPDLLITVDNGVSSIAGVEEANELGMQVLITDHHLPGEELPDADASSIPISRTARSQSAILRASVLLSISWPRSAARWKAAAEGRCEDSGKVPRSCRAGHGCRRRAARSQQPDSRRAGTQRIRAGRAVPGIAALLQPGRQLARASVPTSASPSVRGSMPRVGSRICPSASSVC